jgi:hypothetical protein
MVGEDVKEFMVKYLMDEEVLPTRFGGMKNCEELFADLNAPSQPVAKGWLW